MKHLHQHVDEQHVEYLSNNHGGGWGAGYDFSEIDPQSKQYLGYGAGRANGEGKGTGCGYDITYYSKGQGHAMALTPGMDFTT